MSELSHDTRAKLVALKEKREKQNGTSVPSANITEAKVETPAAPVAPPVEAVPPIQDKKATPVVDPPKAETTSGTPPSTSDTTGEPAPLAKDAESSAENFRWDADVIDEKPADKAAPSQIDFKKLGSAFEIEASTEEEFVKSLGEKAAKLKTLEEQLDKTFEGVPAELKEAMEVAKKQGDWYSFIEHSLLDVTKLDAVDLFEQEYERLEANKYRNPDGSIDYAKLDEALDSVPEAVKTMQGEQIKARLYMQQQQKKQQILAEAEKRKEVFTMQLGEAVKELPNFFPKDTFGITVEPKHMTSIYDGVANGKLIQKHLGNIDPGTLSKLDAKKLTRTLAMAEWAAGISKSQYNKGLVSAKKEMLDKTQNVQISKNGIPAAPEMTDAERPKTAAEKLKGSLSGRLPQNSL